MADGLSFPNFNYSDRRNPVKSLVEPDICVDHIFFVLSFKEAPIAPIVFQQISSSFYINTTCYWNFIVCSIGENPKRYAKFPNREMNRVINREGDLIMFVDVRFGRG